MLSATIHEKYSTEEKPDDTMKESSDFGDAECGEPAFEQHLVLDFTPDPWIDNDIVQKKVCDFWTFINNNPDIQNLKVLPSKCNSPSTTPVSRSKVVVQKLSKQSDESIVNKPQAACSTLEDLQEKKLINRALATNMNCRVCSLDSSKERKEAIWQKKDPHRMCLDFDEDKENVQQRKKPRAPIICRCTEPCRPCPVKKAVPSALKKFCTKLEEWDEKHPKSMDPPGHPIVLQHCVIHRQVFERK